MGGEVFRVDVRVWLGSGDDGLVDVFVGFFYVLAISEVMSGWIPTCGRQCTVMVTL